MLDGSTPWLGQRTLRMNNSIPWRSYHIFHHIAHLYHLFVVSLEVQPQVVVLASSFVVADQ